MTAAILFNCVSFTYGNDSVLNHITFELPNQSISVLYGPSGSGKTTCLRLIAGLENPSSGKILLFGKDAATFQPNQREVGYCFQEPALWHEVTVYDHIRLCMKSSNANDPSIKNVLKEYHLNHVMNHLPYQLSGGEKKRLDFARAAASKPKLLLLDEPLSSLDEPMREELIQTITYCRENGGSVVAVTHQKDEMFALAEHLVILHNGQVMNEGIPEKVYHQPNNRMTAELMGLKNIFPVTVDDGTLHTPFGSMKTDCSENGEWLAGCGLHDFEIKQHESGNAVIKKCVFQAGLFLVEFEILSKYYLTLSFQKFDLGHAIQVSLNESYVLIEKNKL